MYLEEYTCFLFSIPLMVKMLVLIQWTIRRSDPKIGSWQDISRLSEELDIMSDLIVNHISADSHQFKDLMVRGRDSEFDGLFLTFGSVFPAGASEEELLKIYRPRPGLPFTAKSLPNGSKRIFWTTFTEKQLDINVTHNQGKAYLGQI